MRTKFVFSAGEYADADSLSSYFSYATDKELKALEVAYPDDITQVNGHSLFWCEVSYI